MVQRLGLQFCFVVGVYGGVWVCVGCVCGGVWCVYVGVWGGLGVCGGVCVCARTQLRQMCPILRDPTDSARLLCPWDFPSENPGAGYRFLLKGPSWPRERPLASCVPVLQAVSQQRSPSARDLTASHPQKCSCSASTWAAANPT